MPEFIDPIVANVIAVLRARTPALLDAVALPNFVDFGKQFTGITVNFPSVWVMPVRTLFGAEMQQGRHEEHQVTVKFGVSSSEPDAVTQAAVDYMVVIDRALSDSDPADWTSLLQGGQVLRVFVQSHDYGALLGRGSAIARFPELDLVVETME